MSGRRRQRDEGEPEIVAEEPPPDDAPPRPHRRRRRVVKVLLLGGAIALVTRPEVRNRVLDAVFGPEEEFEYESETEPATFGLGDAPARTEPAHADEPPEAGEQPTHADGEAETEAGDGAAAAAAAAAAVEEG